MHLNKYCLSRITCGDPFARGGANCQKANRTCRASLVLFVLRFKSKRASFLRKTKNLGSAEVCFLKLPEQGKQSPSYSFLLDFISS